MGGKLRGAGTSAAAGAGRLLGCVGKSRGEGTSAAAEAGVAKDGWEIGGVHRSRDGRGVSLRMGGEIVGRGASRKLVHGGAAAAGARASHREEEREYQKEDDGHREEGVDE